MARDSSGTFTLPLADVVTGTTIEASWANTTLNDIKTELTDSLSRSGKGNMSAAFKIIAGTVSAPGLSFTSEANSGLYRASSNDLRFAVNGAENWRATTSGFRITGDLVLGTAGEGVDFSANTGTAATGATTSSELFDHYEEGSWTPNLWDASLNSSESQTYSTQMGRFTRVGNIVFVTGRLAMSSLGTLSGSTTWIGPLPYSSAATAGHSAIAFSNVQNVSLSSGERIGGYIQPSTNYIAMVAENNSGTTAVPVSALQSTTAITFSGFYVV